MSIIKKLRPASDPREIHPAVDFILTHQTSVDHNNIDQFLPILIDLAIPSPVESEQEEIRGNIASIAPDLNLIADYVSGKANNNEKWELLKIQIKKIQPRTDHPKGAILFKFKKGINEILAQESNRTTVENLQTMHKLLVKMQKEISR